jgi:hypothetical protein
VPRSLVRGRVSGIVFRLNQEGDLDPERMLVAVR